MIKGGYKVIDLKGIDVYNDGDGATIKGVYAKLEETTKPILVSGFVYNEKEYGDFFATKNYVGSDFVLSSVIMYATGVQPAPHVLTIIVGASDLVEASFSEITTE